MPVIPAVGRLSQENREFEVRLLYIEKAIERERERERERIQIMKLSSIPTKISKTNVLEALKDRIKCFGRK
jgi:hypothetical protein